MRQGVSADAALPCYCELAVHFENRVSVLGTGAGGCVSKTLVCFVLDMWQRLRMAPVKPGLDLFVSGASVFRVSCYLGSLPVKFFLYIYKFV